MFTGLIEEIGKVHRIKRLTSGAELVVETVSNAIDAAVGESIAVNGICLTATSVENRNITTNKFSFIFDFKVQFLLNKL